MLTKLLAATVVAALGAGAGFYYAFSDASSGAGCPLSAASHDGAVATSEGHSCCASMLAAKKAKKSACCADEGGEVAEGCPFSADKATPEAVAAFAGGAAFAAATPATSPVEAVAAFAGGMTVATR